MRGNDRHKRSPVVALIVMVALLASVATTTSAQGASRVKVLIAFAQPPGPAEQALVRGLGGEVKYSYRLVPAIAASVPEAALDALRRNPNVTAVEPDLVTHISDAELDSAWGVKRIGAGLVHAQGNVGAGVKVGILDSGIDLDHPDLTYDPSCSANFVEGETLDDGNSHGTHVAGTIAGLDNDSGVVGVAPGATLCIYKVFDSAGNADYSDIIAAVERAVDDGVQIVNHSWGDPEDPGTTVKAAFDTAYAAGVLHVAAAGNNGLFGLSDSCIYPALWDTVIATAATTQSDTRDYYSSICPEVELAAPGSWIYSTMPGGGYGYKSGTSMASPHVAGTAALVLAAHPGWSNDQVRAQLQATADDLGDPGRDSLFGYGLVDADEAAASPNNPPVADDQAVTTDEDTPVGITLNASDVDGDPLTYAVTADPSHGALSGIPPALTYTPAPNYNGPDSFTFVANDGQVNSNVATVSITVNLVNDAPIADDQAVTTDEDTPVAILLTASDANNDPLTFSIVAGPAHGALSGTAPDQMYTPDANYYGSDSFTFVANDGQANSNVATVSITVNSVNDTPIADDQAVTTDEDTPIGIILHASDVEGDLLTYAVTTDPSHGALSGIPPALTYTPDPNYSGLDSFTFTANDRQAASNVATISITVNSVNDAPIVDDQAVTTDEDTPVAITLTGSDLDGDSLTYSVESAPAFGTLAGTAPDLTYTPGVNYYGSDSFAFVANDGQVNSNVATVSITVNSVNDAPSAAFSYSCTALSCAFDASGSSDPEQGIISYEWDLGDDSTGSSMVLSHDYAAAGTYDVALTVTDGGGASDTDLQTVTVSSAPPSMHIGDLDGSLASANKSFWWAEVRITVHDQDEAGVAEATVQGTWSGGASGSGSCLTGTDGTCTVLSPKVPTSQETVTFVVDGVVHAALPYQPAESHDPDGDSDGTGITVSQAGNQPPVAQFTYSCDELICTFDGSGSYDPDGSIVSYEWDLGDGTSATGDNASHTYTTAGTYTVVLIVTDNDNATSAESQNVSAGVSSGTMYVPYIVMSVKSAGVNQRATAVVAIHDTAGSPVAGATVYGTWSGDVSGSVSGVTAADGTVALTSGKVRQASATFTFTVDDVRHDSFTYEPGLNKETSKTIIGP